MADLSERNKVLKFVDDHRNKCIDKSYCPICKICACKRIANPYNPYEQCDFCGNRYRYTKIKSIKCECGFTTKSACHDLCSHPRLYRTCGRVTFQTDCCITTTKHAK